MSDEWGPWIEHDGMGFPVRRGEIVQVVRRSGDVQVIVAGTFVEGPPEIVGSSWHFGTRDVGQEIIRYRIRKDHQGASGRMSYRIEAAPRSPTGRGEVIEAVRSIVVDDGQSILIEFVDGRGKARASVTIPAGTPWAASWARPDMEQPAVSTQEERG